MPSVSCCIPSGLRYGNVPNELVHRAGPPFLDNHYRGYQWGTKLIVTIPKQIHTVENHVPVTQVSLPFDCVNKDVISITKSVRPLK